MQFLENGQYILLTAQAHTELTPSQAEDSPACFSLQTFVL